MWNQFLQFSYQDQWYKPRLGFKAIRWTAIVRQLPRNCMEDLREMDRLYLVLDTPPDERFDCAFHKRYLIGP